LVARVVEVVELGLAAAAAVATAAAATVMLTESSTVRLEPTPQLSKY